MKLQLLEFSVSETDHGRGFWLDKPWVEEGGRPALVAAALMVVPTLHEDEPPTFPVGTGEFLQRLGDLLDGSMPVAVAMSSEGYMELALHSKAWRLPTFVLGSLVLPVVLGILTNRLDEVLPGHKTDDTAEIEIIVETPDRRTLRIKYKGPVEDMGRTLETSVSRYIDTVAKPIPPATPSVSRGNPASVGREGAAGSPHGAPASPPKS